MDTQSTEKTKSPQSSEAVSSLLKQISKKSAKKHQEVIYGIYDNRNASLFTKINDFLIDHSRVGLKEKAYFFHLLAVMVDAGISVLKSLQVLSRKTDNPRFQRIINTLTHTVSTGQSLSDGMTRFADVFTEAEVGVIRAGEAAGNLKTMLFRLSAQTDKAHALQTKLITASIYPIAILLTLIGVVTALMIWIVPNLIGLLEEGGLSEDQFPGPTKVLLGISNVLTNFWWIIILGIIILVVLYKLYRGTEMGKFQTDYYKLLVPITGSLARKVLVLRFVSLLGILIEAGVPVIKALQIIATSIDNQLYKLKTWEVINKVQAGEKISTNLMESPFLFPETITQMLNIGENTASVALISEKIADHFDREIDNTVKRLTALLEPVMILVVGLVVAFVALAMLMPVFDLTSTI